MERWTIRYKFLWNNMSGMQFSCVKVIKGDVEVGQIWGYDNYYERFENVETKTLSASKRIFVRLRHNRFEFLVGCGISEVWVVT